jgi:hypothetical protein
MLLFSTEDLKWETYQTTEVYLAVKVQGHSNDISGALLGTAWQTAP